MSASAATLSSTYSWGTSFSSASDGAGFNLPSGSSYGGCRREVSGGAAWYTWTSSGSDNTRCYPTQTWDPDRFNGIVHTGRYWVDIDPAELSTNEFFSLATFKLVMGNTWTKVVTLNLKVDTSGPTAGKARLLLWHVPNQGQGEQTRVRSVAFPLRTWVDLGVSISPSGAIVVTQEGQTVLTATKKDAGGGWVSGVHFGGYASPGVRKWKIGNDDIRVRSFGSTTTTPPPSNPDPTPPSGPAPPPSGGGGTTPPPPAAGAAKGLKTTVDVFHRETRFWFTGLVAGGTVTVDGVKKTVVNNGVKAALTLPDSYKVKVTPPASSPRRTVQWNVTVSGSGAASITQVNP